MDKINTQLEYERIRILYSGAPRIIAGTGMLVVFLTIFIKDYLPAVYVWSWMSASLLLLAPGIIVARLFKKRLDNQQIKRAKIGAWERRWIYTVIPISLSMVVPVFFPLANEQFIVVVLFLTVLGASNLMTSGASIKTVAVANGIIFIPLISRLFLGQEPYFILLGFFYIASIVVFGSYALSLNHTMVENIRYKINSNNLSLKDPLTRLHNRRGMTLFVDKLIPRSRRSGKPFGLMIMDIDFFKKYNDTFGHSAGDSTLKKVAKCLIKETRDDDMVVRYGGEEFMIITPETSVGQIQEIAERLRQRVRADTDVTISIGLAIYSDAMAFATLIEKADEALYAAKDGGRNMFVLAAGA
ncbi:MAG: GGDEF domain-containing protein [Proteobacteria bacterium]|nr:GGDEF domain-containing protein [Pseudomonadota bacterium]